MQLYTKKGQMAHILMYMDTHTHTLTQMHPCKDSHAHSQQKGHGIQCVRKRYLKRICCLLLWRTPRGKHTHAKTHTYTWCSINLKETGAIAWLWEKPREEAAAPFQEHQCLNYLSWTVWACQSLCLSFMCVCFMCMYRRKAGTFQEQHPVSLYSFRTG